MQASTVWPTHVKKLSTKVKKLSTKGTQTTGSMRTTMPSIMLAG